MNVRYLKLTTGEEIVTEVLDEAAADEQPNYRIKNPLVAYVATDRIAFGPWAPLIDEKNEYIELSQKHVLFVETPNQQIIDQYKTQFGSGIVTPPPLTIVGK